MLSRPPAQTEFWPTCKQGGSVGPRVMAHFGVDGLASNSLAAVSTACLAPVAHVIIQIRWTSHLQLLAVLVRLQALGPDCHT